MPRAIVTGASSGIGYALARELAARGYDLGLMSRRIEPLEALRRSSAGRVWVQPSDFSKPEEALGEFKTLWQAMGGADLVILNAGVSYRNEALSWELDRAMIHVNLVSLTAMADEAARCFLRNKTGHLVGISSIAGLRGSGKAPVYGATKAFVSNFLQGLRQRIRAECRDICVTDVRPGFVETAMIAESPFLFWAAAPEKAACQIADAIGKKQHTVYITRRWGVVAWFYGLLPETFVQLAYNRLFRR